LIYDDLKTALDIFGLDDTRATVKEIKAKHRELVKKYHPDAGSKDTDHIKGVNAAYKLLSGYCENYKLSFSQEEFYIQYPQERLKKQYMEDPLWGWEK
jgi:curved DNA-binding protein CbpA